MECVVKKRPKVKKLPRVRQSKAEAEAAFRAWQGQHADSIDRANVDRLDAALGKATALAAKVRATAIGAMPTWANHKAVEAVYAEAARLGLEVDHVIPLKGKQVCGLHVEGNLVLLTKLENQKKGNRYLLDE
jgi:5-methylcytosine-specific restriction endonuclease McrA